MFSLNEARKIAGLPPLKESGDPDIQAIYDRALRAAKSPDQEITDRDEKSIKQDIKNKLEKGWTSDEIRSFLKWTEYFNIADDEDYCLRKMKEVSDKVKERLGGKTNESVELTEGKSAEVHHSKKGIGALGDMWVIDGTNEVGALAEALGIPDGWKKPVKVGKLYASFSSGDRLTFFANERDYVADDDE